MRIDAAVRPNGDLRVTEQRTFSFDGNFHFVYWDISTEGSQGIKVLGVDGPDGRSNDPAAPRQRAYTVAPRGESVRVTAFWPMSASDTFTLRYRALGAATRYADTGELYWQFIGDGWGAETAKADIVVTLPKGVKKAQVRAGGHGPLNGEVDDPPRRIRLLLGARRPAEDVRRGPHPVPAAALSTAPVVHGDGLPAALAAEKRWADEAERPAPSGDRRARGGQADPVRLARGRRRRAGAPRGAARSS